MRWPPDGWSYGRGNPYLLKFQAFATKHNRVVFRGSCCPSHVTKKSGLSGGSKPHAATPLLHPPALDHADFPAAAWLPPIEAAALVTALVTKAGIWSAAMLCACESIEGHDAHLQPLGKALEPIDPPVGGRPWHLEEPGQTDAAATRADMEVDRLSVWRNSSTSLWVLLARKSWQRRNFCFTTVTS